MSHPYSLNRVTAPIGYTNGQLELQRLVFSLPQAEQMTRQEELGFIAGAAWVSYSPQQPKRKVSVTLMNPSGLELDKAMYPKELNELVSGLSTLEFRGLEMDSPVIVGVPKESCEDCTVNEIQLKDTVVVGWVGKLMSDVLRKTRQQ